MSNGTFSSLRYRNFRLLWLGQISHAGALWMEQIARPFLVLELTGSEVHLGAVIATRTLPQVVLGVWAGVVSDWYDRRKVLVTVKSLVLAVNIVFAALIVAGLLELWHIYCYALVRGALMAFDQPARQSMIPSIVPAERVTNALGLMSATLNIMRILGAALGGVVYATIGAEGSFSLIAFVYVGAVLCTYLLDVPTHERPAANGLGAMVRGLWAGLRFAFHDTAIRGVLALALVYFAFGMSFMQVFLPLFADKVLDVGSAGFGLMSALMGSGALAAAIAIARFQPARLGFILPLAVCIFGVIAVGFSLATYLAPPLGFVLPLMLIVLAGATQTSFLSLSRALMLHVAPASMRGRVLSLLSLDRAFMSAGAAGAGMLSAALGVQLAQILYGIVCVAGGLAVYSSATAFRRLSAVQSA